MTKETYLKSVDTLLDAYNREELFHGNCNKCAVGNLLGTSSWQYDFVTAWGQQGEGFIIDSNLGRATGSKEGFIEYIQPDEESKILIRTYLDTLYSQHGFTKEELARIEYAFESSIYNSDRGYNYYSSDNKKEGQFIGLTAVLKVMKDMVEEEVPSQDSQDRLEKIAREKYCVII